MVRRDYGVGKELKDEFKVVVIREANEWDDSWESEMVTDVEGKPTMVQSLRVDESINHVPLLSGSLYFIYELFIYMCCTFNMLISYEKRRE